MAETLDDPVSPALEREISERLENEVECLEAEKRAYEDLEFQIMESTARRDERIEEVRSALCSHESVLDGSWYIVSEVP